MNRYAKAQEVQEVATRIVEGNDYSDLLSTDLLSAAMPESRSLSADYDAEDHVISVRVEYTKRIETGAMSDELNGEEPTQPGSEDLERAWRSADASLVQDIEYELFVALGTDAPATVFTFVDVTNYDRALEREAEFAEEG